LKPNARNNGSAKEFVVTFFNLKKPGKKLRFFLNLKKTKNFKLEHCTSVASFMRITEQEYTNDLTFGRRLSSWKSAGLSNRVKTFIFKFYGNSLGLNTRVSHFAQDVNRACTFCSLAGRQNIMDETFKHLFLDCQTTKRLHDQFLAKYFAGLDINAEQRSKFFFLGLLPENYRDNHFVMYAVLLFQYCIWEWKLQKKTYSFNTMEINYLELVAKALRFCKTMRVDAEKLTFPLCRTFGYGVRPLPPGPAARAQLPPAAPAPGAPRPPPAPAEWRPP